MVHTQKERHVAPSLWKVPQLYSPYGELYCFAVVFGFHPSYIRSASLDGEYNITKIDRLSYHFANRQNITATVSLQYHAYSFSFILAPIASVFFTKTLENFFAKILPALLFFIAHFLRFINVRNNPC